MIIVQIRQTISLRLFRLHNLLTYVAKRTKFLEQYISIPSIGSFKRDSFVSNKIVAYQVGLVF